MDQRTTCDVKARDERTENDPPTLSPLSSMDFCRSMFDAKKVICHLKAIAC